MMTRMSLRYWPTKSLFVDTRRTMGDQENKENLVSKRLNYIRLEVENIIFYFTWKNIFKKE